MTSCLYECLCQAGLQGYYRQFSALGLSRPTDLSRLTMSDYPKLGVQRMEDRTSLFRLVQLVKALEEESNDRSEDGEAERVAKGDCDIRAGRAPLRRRLDFSGFSPEPRPPRLRPDKTEAPGCSAQVDTEAGDCRVHVDAVVRRNSRVRTDGAHRKTFVEQEAVHVRSVGYKYGLPFSTQISSRVVAESGAGAERIRVCVRKRPLSCAEERRREADVVTVQDGECVLIHQKKEAVDLCPYALQHAFYFDEAFGEECTNEEVYLKTAYPLIQHVFNGGNATCFAFGQTGAGKTHTMLGSTRRSPGLYALAAQDIFAWLGRSAPDPVLIRPSGPLHVCISFFEIYCGQLYDLLDHRKRLFAREDGHHMVQIVGLREIKVESVNALLEVISSGNRDRSRGSSGVNSESSRSHALLQIQLRNHTHQMVGRISFVDLAGSERAADTRDPGRQRRLEGAEINQSLLALKECIRALDQEHTHTPFRQSKLTQVLKDSFIGNSRTCMIANISSGQMATEHTLNTLRYADRVKELKRVQKNSMGHTHVSSTKLGTHSSKHENGRSGKKEGRGFVSEVTPTGTLPFDDNLTSTPKVKVGLAECGVQREIRLDQATPVRGTLGGGAWTFRRGGEGVKRQVEEKSGEALGLLLTLASVKEAAPATDQLVWKDDSSNGYKARGVFSGCQAGRVCRVEGEMLGEEKTDRPQMRWKKSMGREESERERHLRRYHQQLQQFDPATSLLSNGLVQQPLEDLLALYGARAEKFTDGCTDAQVPSSKKALSSNDSLADPSEIGKWVMKALDADALTPQLVLSKRESCAEGGKGRGRQDKATGDLEFGNEEPKGHCFTPKELEAQKTLSDLRWRLDAGAEERLDVAGRVYGNGQMTNSPARVELTGGDSSEGETEGLAQPCWKRFECGTEEERNYNGGSSDGSNGTSSVAAERPFSPTSSRTFVEPEELQDVVTGLTVSCDVQTRGGPRGKTDALVWPFAELGDTANVPSDSSAYAPDAGRATGRTCLNEGDDTDHCPLSEVSTESRPLGQVATAKSPGVLVGEGPSAAVPSVASPGLEAAVRDDCLEMEFKTTAVSSPPSHDSTVDSTCTNTTMGPLSVSELCVERRAATDSFLQWASCSPCPSPNGEQGKKAEEEKAPCALGTLASKTYDGCPESSVEPDVQRRLQRLHREDCFMDVNGISTAMELFPSFGYSPGCFLETVAQQGRKILDDRNSAVTIDVSNKQDQVSAIKKDPGEKLQRSQLDLSAPESPKSQTPSYGTLATATGGQFVSKHFARHGGYDALGETNPYPGVGPGEPTCDSPYRRKVLGERGSTQDARQTEKLWKPDLVSRPTLSHQSFRSPALRSQHTRTAAQPSGTFLHGTAMGEAQRLLVQAHCQQLEEMELLFREEALLILQTDMDFTDYVLKLGKILETKAKCVHSMRAQLLQYLAGPLTS